MSSILVQPSHQASSRGRLSEVAFGQVFVFGLLSLLAAFLFVATQSMLSGGDVTPKNIDQWLIGFLPVLIIFIWSFLHSDIQLRLARAAIIAWNAALIVFVLVHEFHYSNQLKTILFELFGYQRAYLVEGIISILYAISGAIAARVLFGLMKSEYRQELGVGASTAFRYMWELFLLNSFFFGCLVYRLVL